MVAALQDFQDIGLHTINQTMFAVDTTRPTPRQIALQGFGLARAFKGVALAFLDKRVQLAKGGTVGFLPKKPLFPGRGAEKQVHAFDSASNSAAVRVTPLPSFASAKASINADLLAGEAIR